MAQPTIKLTIPLAIFERAEALTRDTSDSTESVLVDSLELLFPSIEDAAHDPTALDRFSDEQLWMIVRRRLTPKQEARCRELADRGNRGVITDSEIAEMESWVARVDNQMLLRSKALLILQRRGHDIDAYFSSANE